MNKLREEINRIVQNKEVSKLAKYVKIVKIGKAKNSNGSQTLSGYLLDTYPNIENYNTIPFNCH